MTDPPQATAKPMELVFHIVGGPYDESMIKVVVGEPAVGALDELQHNVEGRLQFREHQYRIVEFNPQTMTGVLMW